MTPKVLPPAPCTRRDRVKRRNDSATPSRGNAARDGSDAERIDGL
jgi:hypothetical protein